MNNPTKHKQLAAILFVDIVAYTALMQKDEDKASAILLKFQKEVKEKVATYNGQVINFYGDGALCIFQTPIEAVRSAMALQIVFHHTLQVPVRMGIHSGTITIEQDKVFGNSVNLTSRIESMGAAGAILFSKKVRDEIKNHPDLQMSSLGSFEFKNVEEPMEIFALSNPGFFVPDSKKLEGKIKKQHSRREQFKKWVGLTGVLALLVLSGMFLNKNRKGSTANTEGPGISQNSIAVLPFRNDSNEAENEYFCNGIMDDVLTQLQKIGELRIISRSSVMPYKKNPKPIPLVGKELGVAYVLDGAVRKSGGNVLITAQLIDAKKEGQIWAERYNRKLSAENIFEVQSDIARQIARALQTNISPDEQLLLDKRPTDNLEAYDYFLRGLDYYRNRGTGDREGRLNLALQMFDRAAALDSNFAMLHLRTGYCHDDLYWFGFDRSPRRAKLTKQSFDKALSLAPDNPEVKEALGWYYYHFERNYEKAKSILEPIIKEHPQLFSPYNAMGAISSRMGNWDEAEAYFRKAMELSPNYQPLIENAGLTTLFQRKYKEADSLFSKIISMTPDDVSGYDLKVLTMLLSKGDVEGAMDLIRQSGVDMQKYPDDIKVGLNLYRGDYDAALKSLFTNKAEIANEKIGRLGLVHAGIAQVYKHMNKDQLMRVHADSARILLLSAIETAPNDERLFAALGKAYAFLGENSKALEFANKAMIVMPLSMDARRGYLMERNYAEVLVLTGGYEKALDKLQYLLSIPGNFSGHIIRLDPLYEPLKSFPRFKQLLSSDDFLN